MVHFLFKGIDRPLLQCLYGINIVMWGTSVFEGTINVGLALAISMMHY